MIRAVLGSAFSAVLPAAAQETGYVPPNGFVTNAPTAISIARAVLTPIYGVKVIQNEEPLTATRQGDVWTVKGMLCPRRNNCLRGTAELRLSATDGRVLFVTHYK